MITSDLDGTISLLNGREKYLKLNPKDWDTFYEECDKDIPNFLLYY